MSDDTAPAPAPTTTAPTAPAPVAIGDVVVFHDWADVGCTRTEDRPALVLKAWGPDCANLEIHAEGGSTYRRSVMRGTAGGTWSAKAVA